MKLHWQHICFNIHLKGKVKVYLVRHVKDTNIIIHTFQLGKKQEEKAMLSGREVVGASVKVCVCPCVQLQFKKMEALCISKK